jgi:hypothetical protein
LIAFVDADDLVSREWFARAVATAANQPRTVMHPECNLNFGAHSAIFLHRADTMYDLRALFFHNLWSALSLGPTELYRENPYVRNDVGRGFGYEDWHWNCETLRNGVRHSPVQGTCHFIRLRSQSLSQDSQSNRCVIRRTRVWQAIYDGAVVPRQPLLENPRGTGSLARDLLDADPWEVPANSLPDWLRAELAFAQTIDPAVHLADRLINFSPFHKNLFLPALSREMVGRIARGAQVLRFVAHSSTAAPANEIVVSEALVPPGAPALATPSLRAILGSRINHFLAMLTVQSGIEEIHVHAPGAGVDLVESHPLPLRHSLRKIVFYFPPTSTSEAGSREILGNLVEIAS